jgi:inner membrane protein
MEPITHMLTGAVLARTGLNRKAAYMTAAMVIAADLPDIDTVWSIFWPVTGMAHHRGITHTFLGIPFEAALVTWGCWAFHKWRRQTTATAPNWAWLYGGCVVALASHLLLDWTNNYGVRPFFPFNPHWYAGSFVFIFEPVIFLLLLVALVAPALFGLINSEVGVHKERFRGRGWAIAALAGIAALYGWRYVEHGKAIQIATQNEPAGTTSVFASPQPVNPFAWATVADTPGSYQLGTVDTRRGTMEPHTESDTIYKPESTLGILTGKRSDLGQIYLDWSMYPVISESEVTVDPTHPWTVVKFEDARFMYDVWGRNMRDDPPMTATVTLDMAASEGHRAVEMKMGGRIEK